MEDVLKHINQKSKEFIFLDFTIFKYKKNDLIIAGSDDLTYFHKFEIHFKNLYAVICNASWSVDTKVDVVQIVEGMEAYNLNVRHKVEAGNIIFQLNNGDGLPFYVIAERIEFLD